MTAAGGELGTGTTQPEAARPQRRTRRAGQGPAVVGGAIVAAVAVAAVAGSLFAPYRPTAPVGDPLAAPGPGHLLGTTGIGQDVASQLLAGARVSLTVAVLAGFGTIAIGAAVGLFAGWRGGWVDAVAMRIVDVVLVLPKLPLLILLGVYLGPSVPGIALVISATFWPFSARVIRSQVLSLRHRAHVSAAVGFGAGTWHVLRRHVLPAVSLLLVAELVFAAFRAVLLEAGLAFLGLGDPTRVSWGGMIRAAADYSGLFFTGAWAWWLLPPVVAVCLLLVGITFLGTGAEAWVNPRLVRHDGGGRA